MSEPATPPSAPGLEAARVEGSRRVAKLRTRLCDLIGIDCPVLQSGMGRVAGPDLVAEVSKAGGLGILAGLNVPPDALRQQIRRVRELTDRPFGVNLWLHPALLPPADPQGVPGDVLAAVQRALNGFRARLGLPASQASPERLPDLVEASFQTLLEERVPVFSVGLGNPGIERVRRCRERGIKVVAMVTTVEDARAVAAAEVDVIVAQGSEAGGHRSTWNGRASGESASIGTLALVPQIVDAVPTPVVAAGGIADGRGLVAALALGACGVLLGTRFVATRESLAPLFWKRAIIDRSSNETTVTTAFTGLRARVLRNVFTEEYAASGAPVLPPLLQAGAARDIVTRSTDWNDPRFVPLYSGQGNGLIRDLPGAGEVVRRLTEEAAIALRDLAAADAAA
jgi:nitronate monooxygenase